MENDNETAVKLTGLEETILQLLLAHRSEMFGLELVEKSNGLLARGSVYVTLSRMADKGLVASRTEDRPKEMSGIPRRLYRPTGLGEYALKERQRARSGALRPLGWSPA